MKEARWFLLFYAHAAVTASNPRSVNLALKITFEFNEKKDVAFIKNVRQFLDRIENNVERKLNTRKRTIEYRFTDFLQELISILISYNDRDFKEVFRELYHVVSDQRDGRMELKELISNSLRPVLLEALRKATSAPSHTQKERLKRFSSILSKTDKSHASFVNFLNLLYKGKPSSVFHRILKGFKTPRKRPNGDTNVRELVRDTVEHLVYEHYMKLDDSVRRDVGKWLRTLLKRDVSLEYKQSLKKSASTHKTPGRSSRYTFITLYPEAIDLNVKRVRESSSAAWKKMTVPNKNRFYLVKGKRRTFTGNVSNQEPKAGGWSSVESVTTVRNQPTSAYHKLEQHNAYPRAKSHHPHQTKINDKDPFNKKNFTQCNDSISTNYLERIKRLEEQLNEMKSELRSRISPIIENTSQRAQIHDEYSYMLEDNDPFATDMTNSSESIEDKEQEKNITETVDFTKGPAEKRFRAAISNRTDTITLGDGPLSTEIKEFLNTRPRIISFKATNIANEVTPANDTLTNLTTELNTVTGEDTVVTKVVTAETNRFITSQRDDNVTTVTTELVSSTDATKIVKGTKDTTRLGNVDPDVSDRSGSNQVR